MDRRIWRNFDFVLLGATVALIVYGEAMIYSATINTPGLEGLVVRQAVYAALGLVLMLMVTAIDYRFLSNLQKLIYAVTLGLLGVVFFIGQALHGAQRWISLGLFSLQPSELSKVLVILVLAQFFARREEQIGRLSTVLLSLVLMAPFVVLVYLQPDLGTAIVMLVIWGAMAFAAGVKLRHLGLLGMAAVLAVPFVWLHLKDYMRRRLLLFINPSLDPAAKYNIDQALISIGSGGWLGKGFAHGSQSQLHFLRVRHTDFIFSVIGEELGLAGALVLFILLGIVMFRILRAAEMARDTFGRLICSGVAAVFFFQSTVSIGMNLNLLPVTGVTLPFISSGGSSLVTFLIAEGLVQSVLLRHRPIEF